MLQTHSLYLQGGSIYVQCVFRETASCWPALAEDKISKNPNYTNNEQKTLRFILLKHIFLFYLQQSCEFRSNISVWKVTIRLQMPEIRKEK